MQTPRLSFCRRNLRLTAMLIAFMVLTLLFLVGCVDMGRKGLGAVGSKSEAYDEWVGDPVALSTVRSVAVVPFANRALEPGFDNMTFATRLANQLTSHGKLRVVYPSEVMAEAERENLKVRQHNVGYRRRKMLGISVAEERADQLQVAHGQNAEVVAAREDSPLRELSPSDNMADAVTVGRLLKVDAVLIGTITDFNAYMRPRLSLAMNMVSTGTGESVAQALAELTQWGVPRGKASAMGRIWFRQQNFDSRDGNVGFGAQLHGMRHHTDHTPYSAQVYIRSISAYYDYVSTVLAKALMGARGKAVKEAEKRALAEAKKRRLDQERVRSQVQALVHPASDLPDPDLVISSNLQDARDRTWRPDVYNRAHPDKEKSLHPAYRPGKVTDPEIPPYH